MSQTTRRGFFGRLAAVAAGAVAAIYAKPEPPALAFHKDAFYFVMQDMPLSEFKSQYPQRLDVLYGAGSVSPSYGARVFNA